jgi:uncharacterized protein (TIGR03437 family)
MALPVWLAATVASAQTAGPIPSGFFGMTTIAAPDYPKVNIGTLAHPSTLAWGWTERSKGVYNWSILDNYVAAAQQHGLVDSTNTANFAVTFGSTPQWAAADQSSCSVKNNLAQCTSGPADIQDWNDFITAVMQRYNGKTQPHIRYYELWNEANARNFWTGSYADMVKMAQSAYPIVHADANSMLLTPSVAGPVGNVSPVSGSTWMAGYLDAGGAAYADGGAFHGYIAQTGITPYPMPEQDVTSGCVQGTTCFGSIVTKANTMRQVFDQHGLKGKPMYDTEGSWGDGNITDPDVQSAWLARWYLLQAGLRTTDNLQLAAWYAWGGGPTQTWGDIETASLTPTAAAIAYNQVYTWLTGASIPQPCAGGSDGTWTCVVQRSGGYNGLAVWNTQGNVAYMPAAGFQQFRDLAGNSTALAAGGTVQIGAKPILLEGFTGLANVSAASYVAGALAPESIASAFGSFAGSGGTSTSTPLPTILGGTQVMVTDSQGVSRAAPLFMVSSTQINYQVPPQTAFGQATVTVTNAGSAESSGFITVTPISPGLFTANASGSGVAAAIAITYVPGGAFSYAYIYQCGRAPGACISSPISVSNPMNAVVLELYGTGIRGAGTRPQVGCTLGGMTCNVQYAGPQLTYTGLDQVNILLSHSMAGLGEVDLVLTIDGQPANTVRVNIQ